MSQSTLSGQSPQNPDSSELDPFDPPEENAVEDVSASSAAPAIPSRWDDEDFHYKQIPVLSPVTLVLGLASLVVFATAFGIVIGSVGTIVGLICFLGTVRNRSEIGGFRMTVCGLVLSAGCVVYGSTKLVYDYSTEVPPGFQRTSFAKDIAEKGFKYEKGKGTWAIHPEVEQLNGKQIFLKGFMYPTRQREGITEFILAKDNGECCFGGEPKVTDMILVKMKTPLEVDFTDKRVSVAGEFRTQRNSTGGLQQVYELNAEHFAVSKTAF